METKDFSKLFTEKKTLPHTILAILFVIYLITGYKMPDNVADAIDTNIGKLVIVICALALFAYSNPILGVLGLFVAYKLIQTANVKTGMAAMEKYYPTEQKKWSPFNATNQFPYTLEQEVIKKMTTQKFNTNYVKTQWRPVLDDTYDAEYLHQQKTAK